MATRDLLQNSKKAFKDADKIISFTSSELIKSYDRALKDIRSELVRLYEAYLPTGELSKAQLTQFVRLSGVQESIVNIMKPYLDSNKELLRDMASMSLDTGYFDSGWAIDQASGVSLTWGLVDDTAVRAAVGIGGNGNELIGVMSAKEIDEHIKILTKAFKNYDADSQKWISEEIRQGIIKGDSIPVITKRLDTDTMIKIKGSAERIARTEILRATGIGQQIGYNEAIDQGVQLTQVWDASLDGSTRPSHAAADGEKMDNTTGMFSVSWGDIPGP